MSFYYYFRVKIQLIEKEVFVLLKRRCKITFVTHGETVNTQEGRISDSESYPKLTERGHEQIIKVCELLKKRGVKSDKIYSSPAARCIQSSEYISKLFKKDFEIIESLHIRKCGTLNGKTFETVLKQYGGNFPTIANIDVEGCELLSDFNERVYNEIIKLVKENIGSRLIVVTYPMIVQSIIAQILKVPPEDQFKILIKPGSLSQISFFDTWASLIYSDYIPL